MSNKQQDAGGVILITLMLIGAVFVMSMCNSMCSSPSTGSGRGYGNYNMTDHTVICPKCHIRYSESSTHGRMVKSHGMCGTCYDVARRNK